MRETICCGRVRAGALGGADQSGDGSGTPARAEQGLRGPAQEKMGPAVTAIERKAQREAHAYEPVTDRARERSRLLELREVVLQRAHQFKERLVEFTRIQKQRGQSPFSQEALAALGIQEIERQAQKRAPRRRQDVSYSRNKRTERRRSASRCASVRLNAISRGKSTTIMARHSGGSLLQLTTVSSSTIGRAGNRRSRYHADLTALLVSEETITDD